MLQISSYTCLPGEWTNDAEVNVVASCVFPPTFLIVYTNIHERRKDAVFLRVNHNDSTHSVWLSLRFLSAPLYSVGSTAEQSKTLGWMKIRRIFFQLIWKHFRWVYGPLSSICAQSNNHWTIHILNIVSAYKYSHREMCGCCCCFSRSFIFFSYFRVMMSIQFDALIRFKSFSLAPVVAGAVNRFWMNMCAVKRKENCFNVHHMKIILTHFRMVCRRWLVGWFA